MARKKLVHRDPDTIADDGKPAADDLIDARRTAGPSARRALDPTAVERVHENVRMFCARKLRRRLMTSQLGHVRAVVAATDAPLLEFARLYETTSSELRTLNPAIGPVVTRGAGVRVRRNVRGMCERLVFASRLPVDDPASLARAVVVETGRARAPVARALSARANLAAFLEAIQALPLKAYGDENGRFVSDDELTWISLVGGNWPEAYRTARGLSALVRSHVEEGGAAIVRAVVDAELETMTKARSRHARARFVTVEYERPIDSPFVAKCVEIDGGRFLVTWRNQRGEWRKKQRV